MYVEEVIVKVAMVTFSSVGRELVMTSAHRTDMEFLRNVSNGDPHSPMLLHQVD